MRRPMILLSGILFVFSVLSLAQETDKYYQGLHTQIVIYNLISSFTLLKTSSHALFLPKELRALGRQRFLSG